MFARPPDARPRPAALANWLTFVAVLIFVMIVVGGITRLTESGLSMVRWEASSTIIGRRRNISRSIPACPWRISRPSSSGNMSTACSGD
jgi:hypothetical protein